VTAKTSVSKEVRTFSLDLSKVRRFLIEPPDAIRDPERRRRARLLSSLLAALILLGIASPFVVPTLAPTIYSEDYTVLQDPTLYAIAAGLVLVTVAYILSRTRHYLVAANITVFAISAAAIAYSVIQPVDTERMLGYLVMDVLLGSMLLSVNGTLVLAVANLLGGLLIPVLSPEVALGNLLSGMIYQIIMYTLIMIFAANRQRDLAQIERQTRELAEAVEQAREANRLKSQFLATMSHELRTPLNAIIGFTEVMMMGLTGEVSPQAQHTTQRIHHNSERLLKLIDDLLDISKIEAGRVEVLRQPIEPASLLGDVRLALQPQADEKRLDLITEVDMNLPPQIVGDPQRLEQIILNLGTNAIKFTEQGKVVITLRRFDSDQWGIVVEDTGIGIPAHAQEFVFEKFRQVDGTSRRAYGGTGLGLAIVKELALLMDGNVRVESEPSIGSTFTVTLPLLKAEGVHA
jgi:signal transduction histidine kinase